MSDYIESSFWAIIPDFVLSSTELKPNAKLLYGKITSLQRARGYCYASNKYLADGIGILPDTVTKLLKDLTDAGFIHIVYTNCEGETRRIYTIMCPNPSEHPDKYPVPPGQISGDPPDKYPVPPGQISGKEYKGDNKGENPPIAPQGGRKHKNRGEPKQAPDHQPERFEKFWKFYPRHEDKQAAIRAWDRLKPSDELIDQMAKALVRQKKSDDWIKGIGIPYACKWINNRRWEDELAAGPSLGSQPIEPDMRGGLPAW